MHLLEKKCALCNIVIDAPVKRIVLVLGYTTEQKRYFCSESHADSFEKSIRKAMKNHVPGCRTCFG